MLAARLGVCIAVCLALTGLAQTGIPLGQPDGREFVVRVKPATASCVPHARQTGPFGGWGGLPVRQLGAGAFALTTGLRGQPATTLKVAVWCRGFGMATLDIASLQTSTFEVGISLTPLPEIPMIGRVLPAPDGVSLAGAALRVWYHAQWLCGFYNLPDCGVPQWEVAVDRIAEDGTFRVSVPDFARDPLVRAASPGPHDAGGFTLAADRTSAPFHFALEQDGASPGMVPIAASYPNLVLRPRNR